MAGTFDALPWARACRLAAAQKSLLYALVSYLDERNSCFPSQQTLAGDAGMSERSVRAHLAAWERLGLIRRYARMRDDGRGRTSDRILVAVGMSNEVLAAMTEWCEAHAEASLDECRHQYVTVRDQPAEPAGHRCPDQPATSADQPAERDTTNRQPVAGELPEEHPEGTPPLPLDLVSPPASTATPPTDPVKVVFEAWVEITGRDPGRTRLDPKRRRLIVAALKGYPLDDVVAAVRGWRHSAHHSGENDRSTVYNDLGLLLRNAEHIERFRDLELDGKCAVTAHLPTEPRTGPAEIIDRERRRRDGEACPLCGDRGVVVDEHDVAHDCECKAA